MRRVFCGVDPGFTGAIAFLEDFDGKEVATVFDMPIRMQGTKKRIDRDKLAQLLLDQCGPVRVAAVVEKVGAMGGKGRKEGASSMFRFGQGQGEVLGILSMRNLIYGGTVLEIPPQTWKAKCGLIKVDERALCRRAGKLFPGQELWGPQGGPKHGRAEALFLAAFARMLVERKPIHGKR